MDYFQVAGLGIKLCDYNVSQQMAVSPVIILRKSLIALLVNGLKHNDIFFIVLREK